MPYNLSFNKQNYSSYKKHPNKRTSMATTANINIYLLLKKGDQLLLSLRENTGYMDGMHGLVAGHVENNESASQALVREAMEEAGIKINPDHISTVHIMHRQTDRNNIDIFMQCKDYEGHISNIEPHKCKNLTFYSTKNLPDTTIPYIKTALQNIQNNIFYSELNW